MTPCDFRPKALTIKAFRGFRDSEPSTLMHLRSFSPAQTGVKTSVFDALQWLLLGSIDRLEGLRARKTGICG